MEQHIVGSTGISLVWVVILGLIGAALAALTLRLNPKHRRKLWYDDRHDRALRARAKSLFGPQ